MHNYKELKVWQKAMEFVVAVYSLTHQFPKEELYGLTNQVRRAAISVPLNIAEGAGCDTDGEFARFLDIALRSSYETAVALNCSSARSLLKNPSAATLAPGEAQVFLGNLTVGDSASSEKGGFSVPS